MAMIRRLRSNGGNITAQSEPQRPATSTIRLNLLALPQADRAALQSVLGRIVGTPHNSRLALSVGTGFRSLPEQALFWDCRYCIDTVIALLLELNGEHQPGYCKISELLTRGRRAACSRTVCTHECALSALLGTAEHAKQLQCSVRFGGRGRN
jgi:hypothetical protein